MIVSTLYRIFENNNSIKNILHVAQRSFFRYDNSYPTYLNILINESKFHFLLALHTQLFCVIYSNQDRVSESSESSPKFLFHVD